MAASTTDVDSDPNAPVVLHYSEDGISLTGNTKVHEPSIRIFTGVVKVWEPTPHGLMPRERSLSFRWSRQQERWYAPRLRGARFSQAAIDEIARTLRRVGIPNVEIDYQSPPPPLPPEPKPAEVQPTPHGWPPVPLDERIDKLDPNARLRRLPRYGKDDYRWHQVRVSGRGESPRTGLATNIVGHLVVVYPPTALSGPYWFLSVDNERWGDGDPDFARVANRFHAEVVPTLEPVAVAETHDREAPGATKRRRQPTSMVQSEEMPTMKDSSHEPQPSNPNASREKRSTKQAAPKKQSKKKAAKMKAAKKKPTEKQDPPKKQPKKAAKQRGAKKPNWRYTTYKEIRHRFREVDGTFAVERATNEGWAPATAAAAKSIHAASESACSLAARILPTCSPQRSGNNARAIRPSAAEKEAMRRLLGL